MRERVGRSNLFIRTRLRSDPASAMASDLERRVLRRFGPCSCAHGRCEDPDHWVTSEEVAEKVQVPLSNLGAISQDCGRVGPPTAIPLNFGEPAHPFRVGSRAWVCTMPETCFLIISEFYQDSLLFCFCALT